MDRSRFEWKSDTQDKNHLGQSSLYKYKPPLFTRDIDELISVGLPVCLLRSNIVLKHLNISS